MLFIDAVSTASSLFIWLFYGAVSCGEIIQRRMTYGRINANDELRRMWNEAAAVYFNVLSRHFPEVTEEHT